MKNRTFFSTRYDSIYFIYAGIGGSWSDIYGNKSNQVSTMTTTYKDYLIYKYEKQN